MNTVQLYKTPDKLLPFTVVVSNDAKPFALVRISSRDSAERYATSMSKLYDVAGYTDFTNFVTRDL